MKTIHRSQRALKEGELVYYNSTDQVPTKYSKYTVTRSDFDIANYGVRYSRSDAGTITETVIMKGRSYRSM